MAETTIRDPVRRRPVVLTDKSLPACSACHHAARHETLPGPRGSGQWPLPEVSCPACPHGVCALPVPAHEAHSEDGPRECPKCNLARSFPLDAARKVEARIRGRDHG